VSRARRWPIRAVADLVSHPADWEHRSLRSIQPARVLARRIEDDWDLYENRVAARLVDNLLAYLARRLEELRKIQQTLLEGLDKWRHDSVQLNRDGAGLRFGIRQWAQKGGQLGTLLSKMRAKDPERFESCFGPAWSELLDVTSAGSLAPVAEELLWAKPWALRFARAGREPVFAAVQDRLAQAQVRVERTSFWRDRRIKTLWADTLSTETEDRLRETIRHLERVQRQLQALMDAPLYRQVPKGVGVPITLKPTNILVNDAHYRKVAVLWRSWARFGHKRQETSRQRAERRQREGRAWDRFVLHLVARALASLGWAASGTTGNWRVGRDGWRDLAVSVDSEGVVTLTAADAVLRLLPLCARLGSADTSGVLSTLRRWDKLTGEIVAVHVGGAEDLEEPDRASGWSLAGRATLLGCSPWGIDSEERMARLLNGWLNRHASAAYPLSHKLRPPRDTPSDWSWLRTTARHVIALRAPNRAEAQAARSWVSRQLAKWSKQKRAIRAAQKPEQDALNALAAFVDSAGAVLGALTCCPVCGGEGVIQAHPGRRADGSDATWRARCECGSEWGLRPCAGCGTRFRALLPHVGLNLQEAAAGTAPVDWPDKVIGRDVWAQPCGSSAGDFRCPDCGACSGGGCGRCEVT